MNLTCNATLERLRIEPGSEVAIAGNLTFHELAMIIAGACTIISIILSFYLAWRHALNYTRPREQRHIIRILLMVPIYAGSSFLQICFYWHAIYYQVISDCYEAFAIASFFALLCAYIGPDLHEQKVFFRNMYPVKRWVLPINWFAKCCGGQRGPWRTPQSGLTWFNIIWVSIYQYCFIRVAMTITAVVTQYFDRYCESSNNPVFAHIWVIAVNAIAVTIAMYGVIQFYIQLKDALAHHRPFLKVLSIKLVIFLSFWQTIAISIGTSTLNIVHPNQTLAYPDIKVGIPALLLCVEMACFALLHLWAFPHAPYHVGVKPSYYPTPDARKPDAFPPRENEMQPPAGGFMGLKAFGDALNLWDFIKAFGRGMRWLFCGVKRRKDDLSYQNTRQNTLDMDDLGKNKTSADTSYDSMRPDGGSGVNARVDPTTLPIAHEFRRSNFGIPSGPSDRVHNDESDGLIAHAQPNPVAGTVSPEKRPDALAAVSPYHDGRFQERPERQQQYQSQQQQQYEQKQAYPQQQQQQAYQQRQQQAYQEQQEQVYRQQQQQSLPPHAMLPPEPQQYGGRDEEERWERKDEGVRPGGSPPRQNPRNSTQIRVGQALWGQQPDQGGYGQAR